MCDSGRSTPPRICPLAKQTCLIGSRQTADIFVPGDTVSNAHAVIFVRAGRRYIRDLTSISGTLVNGQRCRETELRHGDEIRVATTRMMYHLADGKIMPGISSSDDTKVGMPAIFRGARIPSVPPRAAGKFEPELVMPWESTTPVTIDLD
jgi:predicted component of type VI protein secretion system